jgi:hypothetical protein
VTDNETARQILTFGCLVPMKTDYPILLPARDALTRRAGRRAAGAKFEAADSDLLIFGN